MNKISNGKGRYAVHWETHAKNLRRNFCSLLEHQSLVDVLICCGSCTIQAHKFILAANSPYLREEFEKNPSVEQIVINGCDFSVIKCLIEILYCGHTIIAEDFMKHLVAVAKMFQIKCLESVFNDHPNNVGEIYLPKPQFLTKKPKYPACSISSATTTSNNNNNNNTNNAAGTAGSISQADTASATNILKPLNFNGISGAKPYAAKRKIRMQAEQACAKEAQASRLALASLQKEIAVAPQVNSFIIEDSCTETTVENFIPHADQPGYVQVVNYDPLDSSVFIPVTEPQGHFATAQKPSLTREKLKYILGDDVPNNVEIMFKDNDGNFVTVTEEVLQDLATKEGLQYQVIDEDGHIGELQELHVLEKLEKLKEDGLTVNGKIPFPSTPRLLGNFLMDTESTLSVKGGICSIITNGKESPIEHHSEKILEEPQVIIKPEENDLKFSPDMFFADLNSGDVQNDICVTEVREDKEIVKVDEVIINSQ